MAEILWKDIYNDPANSGLSDEEWAQKRREYFQTKYSDKLEKMSEAQKEYQFAKFNEKADQLVEVKKQNDEVLQDLIDKHERRGPVNAVIEGTKNSTLARLSKQIPDWYLGMNPLTQPALGMRKLYEIATERKGPVYSRLEPGAYEPKTAAERILHGTASMGVDAPIFMAGNAIGGTPGAFGLHSLLTEWVGQKESGTLAPILDPSIRNIQSNAQKLWAIGSKVALHGGVMNSLLINALVPDNSKLSFLKTKAIDDQDAESLKNLGKETLKGVALGTFMKAGSITGQRIANEVKMFKDFKLFGQGVDYKTFKNVMSNPEMGKVAEAGGYSTMLTRGVPEVANIMGGEALISGQPVTAESFGDSLGMVMTMGLLGGRKKPVLDYTTRSKIAETVSKDFGVSKQEAFRSLADPEKVKAYQDFYGEKLMAAAERKAKENLEVQNLMQDQIRQEAEAARPKTIEEQVSESIPAEKVDIPKLIEADMRAPGPEPKFEPMDSARYKIEIDYPKMEKTWKGLRSADKLDELYDDAISQLTNKAQIENIKRIYESVMPIVQKNESINAGKNKPRYQNVGGGKVREGIDRAVGEMYKGLTEQERADILKDKTLLLDHIDPHSTGYEMLADKYKKVAREEVIQKIEENYGQPYGEKPIKIDYIQRKEVMGPPTDNAAAYEEFMKTYVPPEGAVYRAEDFGRDKVLADKKATNDAYYSEIRNATMNVQPEGLNMPWQQFFKFKMDSIANSISQGMGGKDFKFGEMARWGKDFFVRRMSEAVRRNTQAGKDMAEMDFRVQKNTELGKGTVRNEFVEATRSLLNEKGKYDERLGEAWSYLHNFGIKSLKNIKEKFDLSDADMARVIEAYQKTKPIVRMAGENGQKVGLQEYHPSVSYWTVHQAGPHEFVLIDKYKRPVATFGTRQEASDYKMQRMWTGMELLDDYFPHNIKKNVLEDVVQKEAFIEDLVKKGVGKEGLPEEMTEKQKTDAAKKLLQRQLDDAGNLKDAMYGNMQIARESQLPFEAFEHGPEVMLRHLENTVERTERARIFGANDERLYAKVLEVAEEASIDKKMDKIAAAAEYNKAMMYANSITGRYVTDPHATAATNMLLTFQIIRKMPTAAIGQLPQMMAGAWRGSAKSWVKGVAWAIGQGKEGRQKFINDVGVNLHDVKMGLFDEVTNSYATKALKVYQFLKADATSRALSAFTGRFHVQDLSDYLVKNYSVKDGKILKGGKEIGRDKKGFYQDRRLRDMEDLGVSPAEVISQKGISDLQKRQAINEFEKLTNFRGRAADYPVFLSQNSGRILAQFKKFAYSQTTHVLKNFIMREAKRGNFAPLARLVMVSFPAGAIVNELRGVLTGSPSNLKKVLDDGEYLEPIVDSLSTAGMFGMAEMALNVSKHGDPQFGALANDIYQGAAMTQKMIAATDSKKEGGRTAAEKRAWIGAEWAANQLPLAGRWRRSVQLLKNSEGVTPMDLLLLQREKVNPIRYREPGPKSPFGKLKMGGLKL